MSNTLSSSPPRPRLLVVEAWGIGDVALAVPFLREAVRHTEVTLLAREHAAPLLHRFVPEVKLVAAHLPWTAFSGKYRLARWPWRKLTATRRELRAANFDLGLSARPDPRDHAVLWLAGARRRLGYARVGSSALLHESLPPPPSPHRAAHWAQLAATLGWNAPASLPRAMPPQARLAVIHPGAARVERRWPLERYQPLATRLRDAGWEVRFLDEDYATLDTLMDALAPAALFIGNDSGPGHLAALLGVPTFTIFGPQVPEAFHPWQPGAAWVEGTPCPHRPCFDRCRYAVPHCIQDLEIEDAWRALAPMLSTASV
jgi:ADP-heptose:LPS heptosyltransferase